MYVCVYIKTPHCTPQIFTIIMCRLENKVPLYKRQQNGDLDLPRLSWASLQHHMTQSRQWCLTSDGLGTLSTAFYLCFKLSLWEKEFPIWSSRLRSNENKRQIVSFSLSGEKDVVIKYRPYLLKILMDKNYNSSTILFLSSSQDELYPLAGLSAFRFAIEFL